MKYSHFILISVILAISFYVPAFSALGGGSGTKADPYKIYTKEHLEELADSLNSIFYGRLSDGNADNFSTNKYFILMNDITDSVRTVISIDNKWRGSYYMDYNSYFQGHFDGQGHTITLAIKDANNHGTGLFGTTYNASINNLAVTGYVIVNNEMDTSTICHYVGGIVGFARKENNITNCLNSAEIIGVGFTGGIVGHAIGFLDIEKCINIGAIKNLESISICNLGVATNAAGGIIGLYVTYPEYTMNNCINSGFIEGNDCVGGIVGSNLYAKISNCISTGVVKGNTKVGCIVGENQGGTIINCHYDKQMCGGGE